MARREVFALVALAALLLPALATPVAMAESRHRSYADAREDTTIFFALLADSLDEAETLVQAAEETQGMAGDDQDPVRTQARELSSLSSGFSQELIEVIGQRGTAPPRLSDIQADLEAVNEAGQALAQADIQRRANLSQVASLTEPAQGDSTALTGALEALQTELGAIEALREAADRLDERELDTTGLREALDGLETRLIEEQPRIEEALGRLRLPALLTFSLDDRHLALGDNLRVKGLALAGGQPVTQHEIEIRIGELTRSRATDDEGRYDSQVPLPVSLGAGAYEVSAHGRINGTDVTAGPIPITVDPLRPVLRLEPATTVLQERGPLGVEGRLDRSPLASEDQRVRVLLDGRPVANLTTGPQGSFEGAFNTSDKAGGHHTLKARYASADARVASADSQTISIFIPYTQEERLERAAAASDPIYTEFQFQGTGLGLVTDALLAVILIGLAVLVYYAGFSSKQTRLAVARLVRNFSFPRLVRFRPATEAEKRRADPRNAFPPEGVSGGGWGSAELFASFVEGVRRWEAVPRSLTHRELATWLVEHGVGQQTARRLALHYERVRYSPQHAAEDEEALWRALVEAWRAFVDAQPDLGDKPWPKVRPAPPRADGTAR